MGAGQVLGCISEPNLNRLASQFGSTLPEGQPILPGIEIEEGNLVTPKKSINTELLPASEEFLFDFDPRDGIALFKTSNGEVGFCRMFTIDDLECGNSGPLDASVSGVIMNSLIIRLDPLGNNGYDHCRFLFGNEYTDSYKMASSIKNGKIVNAVELGEKKSFLKELVDSAIGYDVKKVFVSNMIGTDDLLQFSPEVCVLIYLE